VGQQKRKNWRLSTDYGITLEKYTQMLLDQKGVCAICSQPETDTLRGRVRQLAVDHNHTTGEVRELICANCNRSIGLAGESISILKKMIGYLEKHNGQK